MSEKNKFVRLMITAWCVALLAGVFEGTTMLAKSSKHVQKTVLGNGMTILVREEHSVPKVSIQLWYNVGAKDEKDGEKGIAHLIEHMIFKGTEKLSESDINVISHKLSATTNAFTSYDYTGYLFNAPTQNWKQLLPVMADCMINASFKDEHLNSEMKAVIQELKMNRDNYVRSMIFELFGVVFNDHPYHYPLIGYKQDLWAVRGEDLRAFYKKHYMPNNATLVVVGDVKAREVFALAESCFGEIPADTSYEKDEFYHNKDVVSRSVTLYRDVQQPIAIIAYALPGSYADKNHLIDVAESVLGEGKSSRLYKKIVDEAQLATSLSVGSFVLFEHGLLFVIFEPKKIEHIAQIERMIQQEMNDLAANGPTQSEVERAIKQARMKFYSVLENTQAQAQAIGESYLATGDEEYIFNYLDQAPAVIAKGVKDLATNCFRESLMHHGLIAPLPEADKSIWAQVQQDSDNLDNAILSARLRETGVEAPVYAHSVVPGNRGAFAFPKAQTLTLGNGLKVLYHHHANTPKINVTFELQAKYYFDPEDKQGLMNFMANLLAEGTENYSAAEFAQAMDARAMTFSAYPGGISMSMLSSDLEMGLDLLEEVVSRATFNEKEIEKVREQLMAALKGFWDDPKTFVGQLVRERVYKGHPYSKDSLGKKEVIQSITREELLDCYKKYMSPSGAKLAIVGDISSYNMRNVLEKTVGKWQGPLVEKAVFSPLAPVASEVISYPINRDQVVLVFAGLSVDRKHSDYDKLLLFDQIFGSGVLGSMHSRLFKLREESGLFYTIGGSLTSAATEEPGMVIVKTIVSLDRLKEAEEAILKTIDTAADIIEEYEFDEAKRAILNSLANTFESNASIAAAFLFLDKYNLPQDYFDNRAQMLEAITIKDMQDTVKKYLNRNQLLTFRVGRVEQQA